MRRHIWILTTALQGRELEDPTKYLHSGWPLPCNTIRSADLRQKSDILCHVSALLTLDAPCDRNAATVNAVAGLVEHDRISILVASMTDAREDGSRVQQPRMSRISVDDARQAMSLLKDWETPYVFCSTPMLGHCTQHTMLKNCVASGTSSSTNTSKTSPQSSPSSSRRPSRPTLPVQTIWRCSASS